MPSVRPSIHPFPRFWFISELDPIPADFWQEAGSTQEPAASKLQARVTQDSNRNASRLATRVALQLREADVDANSSRAFLFILLLSCFIFGPSEETYNKSELIISVCTAWPL